MPDVQVSVWHGLYVPKDTPDEVVQALTAALQAALKDQNVIDQFAALGTTPVPEDQATPEAHTAKLQAQIELWRPIIEEAGVSARVSEMRTGAGRPRTAVHSRRSARRSGRAACAEGRPRRAGVRRLRAGLHGRGHRRMASAAPTRWVRAIPARARADPVPGSARSSPRSGLAGRRGEADRHGSVARGRPAARRR